VALPGEVLDALGWLIWSADVREDLPEADALRVVAAASELAAETDEWGALTCTGAIKLTDLDELLRSAAEAHAEAAGVFVESLAVAWPHAVDPLAPLRSIPGMVWRPGRVHVDPRPAKRGNSP
jgi:hypothetical protein